MNGIKGINGEEKKSGDLKDSLWNECVPNNCLQWPLHAVPDLFNCELDLQPFGSSCPQKIAS